MMQSISATSAGAAGRAFGRRLIAIVLLLTAVSISAHAALPKDGNGWSILTPSSDTRLIYVSSVSGNDSTGAYYLKTDPLIGSDPTNPTGAIHPYATYSAAYAQTRDGYPDWILLKNGETWTAYSGWDGMRNGRGDTERMVITAYGSSTTRPLVKTGTSGVLNLVSGTGGRTWIQHQAIVGIHFYCDERDPGSSNFAGFANGPAGISMIASNNNGYEGDLQNVLIENCQIEWYSDNLVIEIGTATSVAHDIAVRRNVINNAYDIDTNHRAQGWFCGGAYNVTCEENVFDHNGWYVQGDGQTGADGGKATMYNHNAYFGDVQNVTFSGNMFLRASSIGTKLCHDDGSPQVQNVTYDNNLYVEGELGVSAAGNGTSAYGFSNISVTRNVFEAQGRTQPTGRGTLGWSLWIKDWDGGLVQNNIFMHQDNTTALNVNSISIEGGSERNVTIDSNTFYQVNTGDQVVQLADGTNYVSLKFTNNILDTNNWLSQLVGQGGSTFANYTLNNNHYYSGAAAASWFRVAGVNKSFAQWQSLAGESGSTTGHTTFADATRTVETYDAAQSGPGTFTDFITQAKLQSKANWRTAWTANAVNTWIRSGFSTYVAPVANSDSYSTYKNTQLNQSAPGVLANDTVMQGYTLTAVKVTDPGHGTLTLNSNGSFLYTPTNGWSGSDSFTYKAYDGTTYSNVATVTLTVTNRAPVANNDSYSVNENCQLSPSAPGVLGNDTDADGDTLTATKVTDPGHGTLTLNSNGSFTYNPTVGWYGQDTFTYKAYDGTAYSGNATVTITVNQVTPTRVTFTSVGAEDGYVVETAQGSGVGGTASPDETSSWALRLGDTVSNQQSKVFLSFDTSTIPAGATITSATLYLVGANRDGTSPWTWGGTCYVDIKGGTGFNGSTALQSADFQAAADATRVATMTPSLSGGSISKGGFTSGLSFINKTGRTQLRVYMSTATNANGVEDLACFYSGENSTPSYRPVLAVQYQ